MAGAHAIKPRWGQPMTGILAFIVFTIIAYVTWWIFGDPARGIFRYYEQPFTAWLAVMIVVGVWQHIIFGDWPFQGLKPLQRGIVMTITNLVLTYIIIFGLFEAMGKILPFFSTEALVELKLGVWNMAGVPLPTGEAMEELHHGAMEVKMGAVTYWVVTGFVTYPFWTIMFQKWPFAGKLPQPAAGIAEWSVTTVITIMVYGFVVIPHFYASMPGFMKAGLAADQVAKVTPLLGSVMWAYSVPWWGSLVPQVPNYVSVLAVYEWVVIVLFLTANTWLGWPWNYVKSQPLRGLVGTVGMVILAYIAAKICLWGMDLWWGPVGSATADGIKGNWQFRYYHVASIAGFTITPFLMWHHYFDDWPNQPGMLNAGWWIRFVGVFALAGLSCMLWYKISPAFGLWAHLSTAPPTAAQIHELVQHGDKLSTAQQVINKPLPWLFWWLIPIVFNEWFMHKWPFYVEEHGHAEAHH